MKINNQNMAYVHSGRSGLILPRVSLGGWHNFTDLNQARLLTFKALDLGITLLDMANNYGGQVVGAAEANLGHILRTELKNHRDEILVTTKAGYGMWPGPYGDWGSKKYLIASIDQSLLRLGLDYVDIFYHHRWDPNTPLEETMGALEQIVRQGKALYVGVSNYDGPQVRAAHEILKEARIPLTIEQSKYSLLNRSIESNGCLDAVNDLGIGMTVFSPLEQGILTNRYLEGIPKDSRAGKRGSPLNSGGVSVETLANLNQFASSRGQSLARMALSWILKDNRVHSVLVGASSPQQLEDTVKVISDDPLTDEDIVKIESIIS